MGTEFGKYGAREYLAFAVLLLILLMGSAAQTGAHDFGAPKLADAAQITMLK